MCIAVRALAELFDLAFAVEKNRRRVGISRNPKNRVASGARTGLTLVSGVPERVTRRQTDDYRMG
jgi:hypothetical protein